MMRIISPMWCLTLCGAFGLAQTAPSSPKPTHANIAYVENGHARQVLDLYLPSNMAADTKLPLVIWIHGGAWMGGTKDNPQARVMLPRGFAVASVEYRLSRDAIWPAQIHDCKAAVRFLRANASKYHLDPDHFAAWGDSAGGHLVSMLGTSGDVKELEDDLGNPGVSSRVQAVLDWFGPVDLTLMASQSGPNSRMNHDAPNSPESLLLGGPVQEKKDLARTANPINYIDKSDPPFLIMHGDADPLVPHAQSVMFAKALMDAGVEVTLKTLPGAGHGGPQFRTDQNLRLIEAFLRLHLRGP
jgi:acetyl esterase/lipase